MGYDPGCTITDTIFLAVSLTLTLGFYLVNIILERTKNDNR